MKLRHMGHLNRRNKFPKMIFPYQKISLTILDEREEPRFWGKWEKSDKSKGLEPWIHSKIGGSNEAHPSTQTHGKNRRKTHQIMRSKLEPKILKKS
jgi:hypothetical protein